MRRRLLRMIVDAGQGHPGGDLSATDILAALYFDILRIDPANPRSPDRDRFVMSKGHCTGALYSALAGAGFFPEAELDTYLKPESRLNGHPNRTYLPGVETRSEEHTSELQSLLRISYAVFCLKKKKITNLTNYPHTNSH